MTISSIIARRSATLALGLGIATLGLSGAAQARDRSPASAATPVTDTGATMATDASPTKRYCVISPPITGSRLSRKTCMTRADWLKEGFDPLAAQ